MLIRVPTYVHHRGIIGFGRKLLSKCASFFGAGTASTRLFSKEQGEDEVSASPSYYYSLRGTKKRSFAEE